MVDFGAADISLDRFRLFLADAARRELRPRIVRNNHDHGEADKRQ
jgi:hypothetical protein